MSVFKDLTTFQYFPCRGYGVEVVEVSVWLHIYAELESLWKICVLVHMQARARVIFRCLQP